MSIQKFDVIIIGAGKAGPSLAGRLNDAGMKVAIIERHLVGGTCLNTGCKPTKALVASAYAIHTARRGADYGFSLNGPVDIDMPAVEVRARKVILDSRTVDYFHIAIKDRIALSETLSGAAVTAVLKAANITNASQARFFTNALDTTTQGVEVSATWRGQIARDARLTLNGGYARAKTRVDRIAPNSVLPALPLLATTTLDLLTTAQPEDKIIGSAQLDAGIFGVSVNATRFGPFKAFSVLQEQVFSPTTTFDMTA
jgi:hypothetical protein